MRESTLARILQEMDRQRLSNARLAGKLGWSERYLSLRLGWLLPVTPVKPRFGGRFPLTAPEVEHIAGALQVDARQLQAVNE
jgi:hypothetical protein